MKTYVFGHQKPDLDSTVAALSFSELERQLGDQTAQAVIIDQPNPETAFVFSKFSAPIPEIISSNNIIEGDKVILVDHNEESQRLEGLNPDCILKIYDHHKVNLSLNTPVEICIKPVGSSNTLAWTQFKLNNLSIPSNLSPLMLCAILSDTVGLKSSTTTEADRQAVSDLASLSNTSDIDALTLEIFKAKSNISDLTDEQVVLNDYKVFEFGDKKVFIGQIETVEQEALIDTRKSGLLKAIADIRQKEAVDYAFLAITDILEVNTKLLIAGENELSISTKAFGGEVSNSVHDIGPKMSRKKDIAPAIESAITA